MSDYQKTIVRTVDGIDKLIGNLEVAKENMSKTIAKAMFDFAGDVISDSVKLTPIVTGELRARSFVEGPILEEDGKNYVVVLGYEKYGDTFPKISGASPDLYAVPVHERTYAHHETGQAKFLELAIDMRMPEYLRYMAETIKKEMGM